MMLFKFVPILYCIICNHLITTQEFTRNNKSLLLNLLLNKCNCRCGVPNRQDRILGGEITKQYEFPWLAHIQTKNGQIIPATLINDKYLLTSASLLTGLTPFNVKVILGMQDRCTSDVSSTIFSVTSIVIHQLYSSLNTAHDIALVKLNGQVNFEKRTIPICLPVPDRTYLGEVATVMGWTKDDKQDSLSNCRPLKLGLPVLNAQKCTRTSPDSTFFTDDKGCIGVVGASSPICKDDSGGPVMYRNRNGIYEIIGILSDRNTCGGPSSTAMYTRVQDHMSWITENTQDACYCLKI